MITGIIPKPYTVISQNGKQKTVRFIEVKEYSHRPNLLFIDQYYHRNFAVGKVIFREDLEKIEISETGDCIDLYKKIFK